MIRIGFPSGYLFKIPTGTSNYENHDNVYAAYVKHKTASEVLVYQGGLRAESSNYNGELTNTDLKFSNKYLLACFRHCS